MEKQYDVFISYRRVGGKEIARNVQLALQKDTNWKVFLDFDDLDEGRFDQKMMAAIEEAPTFIVVLTPGALDRCAKENDWMRKEILYAHQLGKDIIPLEVDKCYHDDKMSTIPKIVGEVIGGYQFAALDTEALFRESIEKLIIRIRKGGKKVKKSTESGATIHVVNDYPCWVYHFRKEMLLAKTEEDNVFHLRKGRHLLEFKAVDYPEVKETQKVEIADEDMEDMVEVNLKEKVEKIKKKEEEQRIAEEQKRREEEERPKFNVKGVDFRMIKVEGGSFWMGAQKIDAGGQNYDEDAFVDEEPVHKVTLSTFYMGEVVVTQALWKAVMESEPTGNGGWESKCGKGNNYPAYRVSYNDIVNDFLPELNRLTGKNFRLPTEAEWEYAARGGKKREGYKYAGSKSINTVAVYDENSYNKGSNSPEYSTHIVKSKSPNGLGLFDMSGNVWEWCQDWYGNYSDDSQTNPTGPSTGSDRVLRGGSWDDSARFCRVSVRNSGVPSRRRDSISFRLVLPQ